MWRFHALIALVVALLANSALAHEHAPPHGGTLVVLGEEFAHLELVLEPENGELTAWLLDGEAESPVRTDSQALEIRLLSWRRGDGSTSEDAKGTPVRLDSLANVLTGETRGDTSEFQGKADALRGATSFEGILESIAARGQVFEQVRFRFPEGNEELPR